MVTDHDELPSPTPAEPAPSVDLPPSIPAANHHGSAVVREDWMLFDDDRSDQQAEADWTAANAILLPSSSSVTDTPPWRDCHSSMKNIHQVDGCHPQRNRL